MAFLIPALPVLIPLGKGALVGIGGWVGGKAMSAIFGSSDRKNLFDDLPNSDKIISELSELKVSYIKYRGFLESAMPEVNWESVDSSMREAQSTIISRFTQLISILNVDNEDEQQAHGKALQTAILDPSNGILNNLNAINDGLVGETGLLKLWSNKFYEKMMKDTGYPPLKFYHTVMAYHNSMLLLQQMAINLFFFANKKDEKSIEETHNELMTRLEKQQNVMESSLPRATHYIVEPEDLYFVIGAQKKLYSKQSDKFTTLSDYHQGDDGYSWLFVKSDTFNEDGTLLIKHKSTGKYLGTKDESGRLRSPGDGENASKFSIIPVLTEADSDMGIKLYCPEEQKYVCNINNNPVYHVPTDSNDAVWSMIKE